MGIAMVSRVMTNIVLMELMKVSVSFGTLGSKQPMRESKRTEEMPRRVQDRQNEFGSVKSLKQMSLLCLPLGPTRVGLASRWESGYVVAATVTQRSKAGR